MILLHPINKIMVSQKYLGRRQRVTVSALPVSRTPHQDIIKNKTKTIVNRSHPVYVNFSFIPRPTMIIAFENIIHLLFTIMC